MANGYTQVLCFPPSKGIFSSIFPLILTAILVLRNRSKFRQNKGLYIVLSLVICWIAGQFQKYHKFELMNLFLIYEVVMAYILAIVYKEKIIVLYERYITYFASISIFVWFFYNLFTEWTISFFSLFSVKANGLLVWAGYLCNLCKQTDVLGFRNTGFAQEPGFWASFVIIGLFFNLLIHNYRFQNKSFFILLFSLVLSQSTTGYAAFGVIILAIVLNNKRSRKILIFFTILLLPFIVTLPFMKEKIIEKTYSEDSKNYIEHTANYLNENKDGETFVPQRFDGFVFETMNFLYDPLLGYGTKGDQSFVSENISPNISCSNGNIKVFSRYGLILGSLFYIGLFFSGYVLWRRYTLGCAFLWILLYLTLGMSYELTTIPLLLAIWQIGVFVRVEKPTRPDEQKLKRRKQIKQNLYPSVPLAANASV